VNENTGKKNDAGKPDWSLVPVDAMTEAVHVLTYGGKVYGRENWRLVENMEDRYFAAALRHLMSWKRGDTWDEDTDRHHLAHAICSLLFLTQSDLELRECANGPITGEQS
jgi:hypothetical protein